MCVCVHVHAILFFISLINFFPSAYQEKKLEEERERARKFAELDPAEGESAREVSVGERVGELKKVRERERERERERVRER